MRGEIFLSLDSSAGDDAFFYACTVLQIADAPVGSPYLYKAQITWPSFADQGTTWVPYHPDTLVSKDELGKRFEELFMMADEDMALGAKFAEAAWQRRPGTWTSTLKLK